jgi:hypothetical protein
MSANILGDDEHTCLNYLMDTYISQEAKRLMYQTEALFLSLNEIPELERNAKFEAIWDFTFRQIRVIAYG